MALQEHEHVLLLEFLYGLLDEPEASRIRELTQNDPVWQQAHAEAQQAQKMFARAAQIDVAVPPFTMPRETTPASSVPSASDAPTIAFTPPVRRRPWLRYASMALAASLLLGAIGLTWTYRSGVDAREAQLTQIDVQLRTIDTQISQLHTEREQQNKNIPEQVGKRFVHMNALGPAEYRKDAPLPLRVRTVDVRGQALPARVRAVLKANNKEVARTEVASVGDALVELPANLVIEAGKAEVVIEAETSHGTARTSEFITVGDADLRTHLAVNKSNLRTGEILFFRTLTLDRFSMKPAPQNVPLQYALVDAKGKAVAQLRGATGVGGIAGGEMSLASDLESGAYTLKVTAENGSQVAARTLDIARPESPRVIVDRLRYQAGDQAKADIDAPDFKKGSLQLRNPNAAAPSLMVPFNVDRDGKAAVQFRVPNVEGATLLEAQFENGKDKKLVQQVLPVISSKLDVEFFPESGKLIADIPNRVYYRVHTSLGEPVAPEGHVILLSSNDIIFDSEREQGIGAFTFTPKMGESYTVRVTSPHGTSEIKNPFSALVMERAGLALSVDNAVGKEGESIEVVVHNTGFDRQLLLVATCRDRVVGEQVINVQRGDNKVSFPLVRGVRGVVRLTLYTPEANNLERLAERLVYRIPEQRLQLTAVEDKKSYRPGDPVGLKVKIATEKGTPADSWLSVVVVDENELGPTDEVAACLESYFYLFAELGPPLGIERTLLNFADGVETRNALDLYLGTRNWRAARSEERTVVVRADKSAEQQRGKMPASALLFSKENKSRHQLAAELIVQAKQDLEVRIAHQRLALEEERALAESEYQQAATALADYRSLPARYLSMTVAVITVATFAIGSALLLGGLALLALRRSGTPAFAGACACLLICLALYSSAGALTQVDFVIAKAPPAPEWRDADTDTPPTMVAMAGPELPTGRLGIARPAPELAAMPVPSLGTTWAHNVDANRTQAMLDWLPRNERRQAQNGAAEFGRAKNAALSDAAKRRFLENLSTQRSGAGMGGVPASAVQPKEPRDAANQQFEKELARLNAFARPYEHQSDRSGDFQDTVLWKPLVTAPKGEASFSFDLSQRPANYRVIIYGNDAAGRLGFEQHTLNVQPRE